jgi:succinate-acetate transporter protein
MHDELKTANPAPLGLACFGVTTVVLSTINAGLLPAEALPAVVPLAFSFGGFAQIIAGVMEYKNGNTFGTVAFTLLARSGGGMPSYFGRWVQAGSSHPILEGLALRC